MENAVVVREVSVNAEQVEAEPLEQAKPEPSEWVIRRPKRKTVTEEEALKWMESFAAERKEPFIAAIRKSRYGPCVAAHGSEALSSNARGANHGAD